MEERDSGRTLGVMSMFLLLLGLSLLKPTSGSFTVTGALSIGTSDLEESTGLPTFSTAGLSQGTARFGHRSTPKISETQPSFSEKETQTDDNQSSFPEVTESWTAHSRSDMSTELLNSSPNLYTNTVTEWEDPPTVANITEANLALTEERQPASEFRTVRDLTFTGLTEQDLDTPESVSHADSTYMSTTISRAGERTLLSIISNSTSLYTDDSSSFKKRPHTFTERVGTTGEYTEDASVPETGYSVGLSTLAERTEGTSGDLSTRAKPEVTSRDLSTKAERTEVTSQDLSTKAEDREVTSQDLSTKAEHREVTSLDFSTKAEHHEVTSQDLSTRPERTEVTSEDLSTKTEPQVTSEDLSTMAERTGVTSEKPSTNATDVKEPHVSQSHTVQPNMTGPEFEFKPETDDPSSTPSATVINTTDGSSTSDTFIFLNDSHTNSSQPEIETIEPPMVSVGTATDKQTDGPWVSIEETTTPPLTTASPTFWEVSTSTYKPPSTQESSAPQTDRPSEPTELQSTASGPATQKPQHTEKDTSAPFSIATSPSSSTGAPLTTRQLRPATTTETLTSPSTLTSTATTQRTTAIITVPSHPTSGMTSPPPSPSTSQTGEGATDVSTLHLETSTASPSSNTTHSRHTTASYSKTAATTSTTGVTTGKRARTEVTTKQMPAKSTLSPGHKCGPQPCANGGRCVSTSHGYKCECLPAWKGSTCSEDVDECVSSPCPQDSACVNTRGSFRCECPLGSDLQNGRSCTQVRTFLGTFSVNGSLHGLHELHREILQLLNSSLSSLHGYRRSILKDVDGLRILAVSMFSMSADMTSTEIHRRIQMSLRNCSKPQSRCTLQYRLAYHVKSLCLEQNNRCDTQYSVCNDTLGIPYCQCHEGYFKKNPEDTTCRDCGDGFELVNGTCVECAFGFGGFNCNNFYGLIAKVVAPAAGGLLLIVIIALIVTCCRKDKNDINKIIFKSGELQMSPYAEFPKSSRVSMEWGRETIEMQENGSTKNLLQMTDIYYSPALRNADLERNGLYPFSGLPGSRHSCIYPAQWNPSFISDDSRRRDYF